MRFPHGPGGIGLFGTIFTDILAGLVFIILFVVVVGILVLLVRFLLVATKAAELYISKNGGTQTGSTPSETVTKPDAPTKPIATPTPATTPAARKPTTTTPTTPRTRATKTPPPASTS